MKYQIRDYKYDLLLLFTFAIVVGIIEYCYPMALFSWDGNYYVEYSISLGDGIRPLGYSFLLRMLYFISPSIMLVVYAQFFLFFIAIWFFLSEIKRTFSLTDFQGYLLGVTLLVEPGILYSCFSILSDLLYTCFSLFYITTLLAYLRTKNPVYIVLHSILIFFCIETRYTALFYPFLSCSAIIFWNKDYKATIAICVLLLAVFAIDQKINIDRNRKAFGVPVYAAFSGWTSANNVMPVLQRIHGDTRYIDDPELRKMHDFMLKYFDTTSYTVEGSAPDWIWDSRSPLMMISKNIEDSIKKIDPNKVKPFGSMHIAAPLFAKYATYIKLHYPYEFFKDFIVPNFQTLVHPMDGDMSDYYVGPETKQEVLDRYHLKR